MSIAIMRFLFILLISLGCVTNKNGNESEKVVCLRIHWQLIGGQADKAELIEIIDSVFFIKRDEYSVYLIPHITEYSNKTFDSDNEIISDSVVSRAINFQAFIFQKNDSSGIKFDSLSATTGSRFNVDSFLVNKTFKGMKSFSEENDSLIERTSFDRNGELKEKYVPKIHYENSFDSTYFFFTKEKIETDISFSKLLEEKKKIKLYKLIGTYNEIPIGKYPFVVPKRKMTWELQNTQLPYRRKINNLINIYTSK